MKGKEFSGLPLKGSLELENLISPTGPLASLLLGKGEMDKRHNIEQPSSEISRKLNHCFKVAD